MPSSSVSSETPRQCVPSLDHWVTQWMSVVMSSAGSAVNCCQSQPVVVSPVSVVIVNFQVAGVDRRRRAGLQHGEAVLQVLAGRQLGVVAACGRGSRGIRRSRVELASASRAAPGRPGRGPAGPPGGAAGRRAPGRSRRSPRSGRTRTRPRPARSCGSPGGRSPWRAWWRAGTASCRSSRCGRTGCSGAGAATSRRAASHSTQPVPLGGTDGSTPVISVMRPPVGAACGSRAAAPADLLDAGSRTWKRVSPGTDSTRRSPWCLLTTIRQAMSRPSPVPSPTGLVVKNGSKIRSWISVGMPGPVSPISTSTLPSSRAVRMVSVPVPPIAWRRVVDQVRPDLVELGGVGRDLAAAIWS